MQAHERQQLLKDLRSSEATLLRQVDGLTMPQWNFRQTSERWSIAENIEHIILVEDAISSIVAKVMEQPADPQRLAPDPAKQLLVQRVGDDRTVKMKAGSAIIPIGRWPQTSELLAELRAARARSIAFVEETEAELRGSFYPHKRFGDLDGIQWLVVLSQHGVRHALQIEEIKADPAYPLS